SLSASSSAILSTRARCSPGKDSATRKRFVLAGGLIWFLIPSHFSMALAGFEVRRRQARRPAPPAAIIDGRMTADWSPLWISFRVGGLGAAGALALGLWLAWLLATREFRGRSALEAAAEFLLVLPPLILGTYFAFALEGRPESFTWRVAAIAAVVSALPATAT